MKKILVLGGTNFVGRSIVEQLITDETLEVCLFNRNKTNQNLFPGLRSITGDRATKDIEKIASENWDAVIDVSAYYPDSLSGILELLQGKCGHYIFISTGSVYDFRQFNNIPLKETDETLVCSEEERTDTTMQTYGKRKIACELHLRAYSDRIPFTILRPSIIYGKYDHTDRLYYWIYRVKNQQEITLPENGDFLLNLSYMKDISNAVEYFISHPPKNEVYNISTHPVMPFRELLKTIELHVNISPKYYPLTKEAIEAQQLSFPLYMGNLLQLDNAKIKKDLKIAFTDFSQSIRETIDYYATLNFPNPKTGISTGEEQKILAHLK